MRLNYCRKLKKRQILYAIGLKWHNSMRKLGKDVRAMILQTVMIGITRHEVASVTVLQVIFCK